MREIFLTQNQIALVDDEDCEWLMQWKWSAWKPFQTYYAIRNKHKGEYKSISKRGIVRMHNAILEYHGIIIGEKEECDHINGNGLDNQKNNLRIVLQKHNSFNKGSYKNSFSEYKGVSWHKATNKWIAQIQVDLEKIYLGVFKNEKEAARAYNEAALKYHGEYARLNAGL